MTVSAATAASNTYIVSDLYTGDIFNITFPFAENASYLKVFIRDNDDVVTNLVLEEDYNITLSNGLNNIFATLEILKDFPNQYKITIVRSIPIEQGIDFNAQIAFSKTIESALDKITMILQDNQFLDYTVHVPYDEDVLNDKLLVDSVNKRSGKNAVWGDDGQLTFSDDLNSRALRQSSGEEIDPKFEMGYFERMGSILAFDDTTASPKYLKLGTALNEVNNVISVGVGEGLAVTTSNVLGLKAADITGQLGGVRISEEYGLGLKNSYIAINYGDGLDIKNKKLVVNFGNGLRIDNSILVVANGDGLKIDENGLLKVAAGDGLEIDENGLLKVAAGDGLEIIDGALKLKIAQRDNDTHEIGGIIVGDGLNVDSHGILFVNCGDGLTIDTDTSKLSIRSGHGIVITEKGGIEVLTGSGLYFDGYKLTLNTAGYLNDIGGVKIPSDSGLTIQLSTGDLRVAAGRGLQIGDAGSLQVRIAGSSEGTGLKEIGGIIVGDGLSINNDGEVKLKPAKNWTETMTALGGIIAGPGLHVDSAGRTVVHRGDGLKFDDDGILHVNYGDGLTIDENGALSVTGSIAVGEGLIIDADGKISVNCGTGLNFSGHKLTVQFGEGLYLNTNNLICLQPANILGSFGGVRINENFGLTLARSGTPIDYLAIKPATVEKIGGVIVGDGLAIDANGVLSATGGAISIGDGLKIDENGVVSVNCGFGLTLTGNTVTVKIGTGFVIDAQTGFFSLATASTSSLGGVSVPDKNSGLSVDSSGAISVKTGNGLYIDNANQVSLIGTLPYVSANSGLYEDTDGAIGLVSATTETIGGVIIGNGFWIDRNGKTNVDFDQFPCATNCLSMNEDGLELAHDKSLTTVNKKLAVNPATADTLGGIKLGNLFYLDMTGHLEMRLNEDLFGVDDNNQITIQFVQDFWDWSLDDYGGLKMNLDDFYFNDAGLWLTLQAGAFLRNMPSGTIVMASNTSTFDTNPYKGLVNPFGVFEFTNVVDGSTKRLFLYTKI